MQCQCNSDSDYQRKCFLMLTLTFIAWKWLTSTLECIKYQIRLLPKVLLGGCSDLLGCLAFYVDKMITKVMSLEPSSHSDSRCVSFDTSDTFDIRCLIHSHTGSIGCTNRALIVWPCSYVKPSHEESKDGQNQRTAPAVWLCGDRPLKHHIAAVGNKWIIPA